jgi:hypothetical protein
MHSSMNNVCFISKDRSKSITRGFTAKAHDLIIKDVGMKMLPNLPDIAEKWLTNLQEVT